MSIKHIYRTVMPNCLRHLINVLRYRFYLVALKKRIISYYLSLPATKVNSEHLAVVEYLKHNQITMFPFSPQIKHVSKEIEVFTDRARGMRYVNMDGKRLFFKRSLSDGEIKTAYNTLCIEQDAESPHRYLSNEFNVQYGDVVVDVGAGEGNFSLSIIEKASKLYLFESDPDWIEALEATFFPWQSKVVIINKFVSNKTDTLNITLDDYFSDVNRIDFLKIDVEGGERELLAGSETLLSSRVLMNVALCTYHRHDDENEFADLFKQKGFDVSFTHGYMIFLMDKDLRPPYLRKAILRGTHKSLNTIKI